MKKLVSVNGKHDNAVLAIGFTRHIVFCQGVTVFIAAADSEPSAAFAIVITFIIFVVIRGSSICFFINF